MIWQVDGEEYIGTAIGAANLKGSIIFGEAVESDTSLAVSYGTGDTFGLALFVRAMARVYGLMVPPTPSDLKRGHANESNLCLFLKTGIRQSLDINRKQIDVLSRFPTVC